MGSLWAKQQTAEETTEPFRRINVNCLGNILIILSDQIRGNDDLNLACLHLLFMEARKMGSHDVDYIINWIQNHFEISLSEKECENLISFVGLFLPFEAEMETLEEDFAFVQQRCDLIPPPIPLMREWCAQVKLMERNVRIARGYTTEKRTPVAKHSTSTSLAQRFKKRISKKPPNKISVSSSILRESFTSQQETQFGDRDTDATGLSREPSGESARSSPGRIVNRLFHVEDEESKECEVQSSLQSSSTSFSRVILIQDPHSRTRLDHLPEEKIEDMSSD
jgi:hypothetical protein